MNQQNNLQSLIQMLKIPKIDSVKEINHKSDSYIFKNGEGRNFASVMKNVRESASQELVGTTPEKRAQIYQWLEYCLLLHNGKEINTDVLMELNNFIKDKVYFVGYNLTLADILIFQTLHPKYYNMTFQEKEKYIALARWFRHVQNEIRAYEIYPKVIFSKTSLY